MTMNRRALGATLLAFVAMTSAHAQSEVRKQLASDRFTIVF